MNKEQAFKIIDNALASVKTDRQGHGVLKQALDLIAAELFPRKLEQVTKPVALPTGELP